MSTFANHLRAANYYYDRNVREWTVSLFLIPLAVYLYLHRGQYTFMDHEALLIHEAGHFIFAVGGETWELLGGTLMQILLPLVAASHFLRHMNRLGLQGAFFWLSHNLLNISVYAADGAAQKLPLYGGDSVRHDWNALLTRAEMLDFAPEVGSLFFIAAVVAFGASVLLPMLMWSGDE